jgi:hypothetical protein
MIRRLILISAMTVLTASCASGESSHAQGGAEPAAAAPSRVTESAASVAQVVCSKASITLHTPIVQAQRDGVHVQIENLGGVWGFEFRDVANQDIGWNGGPIGRGTTRLTDSTGPGEVLLACLRTTRDDHDDDPALTAKLTIVDPQDLYVPFDLSCGFGEQFRMTIWAGDQSPEEVFRRVPGVRPSDELIPPKYPESPQYSSTDRMVIRDGSVVARFLFGGIGPEWTLLVNACPDSGIVPD